MATRWSAGSPKMGYAQFRHEVRLGEQAAADGGPSEVAELPDPVPRIVAATLRGRDDLVRSGLDEVGQDDARLILWARAARQLGDLAGPAPSVPARLADEWVLPVLRAVMPVSPDTDMLDALEGVARARRTRAWQRIAGEAHLLLSNGLRRLGRQAEATARMQRAARVALEAPVADKRVPSNRQRRLVGALRQEAFRDLVDASDGLRDDWFLCSGTLLGLYRDGDFIPTDGDIDIGVLDPAVYPTLRDRLIRAGRFHTTPGQLESNFMASHTNGSKIDVSLYVDRPGAVAKTSHVYEWQFTPFELRPFTTDYGRVTVPGDVERYLVEMYREWWVKEPNFDSRIDSPNLTFVSPEQVSVVMAGYLVRAFLQGDAGAVRRMAGKIARLPDGIRAGVVSACDGRLEDAIARVEGGVAA